MAYEAKILLDSISPAGHRLTTVAVTYPRMVHSELMTHREFSRNAASSRAIPVWKLLKRIHSDPVWPVHWGANQSGMQADNQLRGIRLMLAMLVWILAREAAWAGAWLMDKIGVHKQLANRLIEPFSWITVIITATEFENFFALRAHPDAQPEIGHIAMMLKAEYDASTPTPLAAGEWHTPFITDEERRTLSIGDRIKISVARCARISYLTHDGIRDLAADLKLYVRLVTGGHLSPLEHVARPAEQGDNKKSNFQGWHQARKDVPNEHNFALATAA